MVEFVGDGKWVCIFMFQLCLDVKKVGLVGMFNGWNLVVNLMKGLCGDGYWVVMINLLLGVYQYKFVVEGNEWNQDLCNCDSIDDNNGGNNLILWFGWVVMFCELELVVGDGKIDGIGLLYDI